MTDSAASYQTAITECRRRLVLADRHRFALPGEPQPGWSRRRARAQTAALLVGVLVCAVVVLAIN